MGLNDTFPMYQPKQAVPEELPNYKIEVKLSLKMNINQDWFHGLKTDLKRKNMSVSGHSDNTITVQGFPPKRDFDKQNVLKIVRKSDSGAQIISARKLPM